jgi:hypothetical protein
MHNGYHPSTWGGADELLLSLEFGRRDEVLDWAKQVETNQPSVPYRSQ